MSDQSATPPHQSSPAPAVAVAVVIDPLAPSVKPTHQRSTSTVSTASSSSRPALLTPPTTDITTKLARNVSPGLLARMKFLNQGNDSSSSSNKNNQDVGRIDEDELRRLDELHKRRGFNIERRGTAWNGIGPPPDTSDTPSLPPPDTPPVSQVNTPPAPQIQVVPLAPQAQTPPVPQADTPLGPEAVDTPLVPQSTGESVPALAMEPDTESDHSSVVSTSDKVMPSESEAEGDDVRDMQKYRLPDITKTKSLSQTVTATPEAAVPVEVPPPPPPPKDTPPIEEVSVLDDNNDGIDVAAYFQKRHLHSSRANSIYTLSKASFTNQIQGLTSMKLPPTTIASEIISLPSSTLAGRALHKAANDIRLWMAKATEVLSGLDAEDDVEWAAAAGREGLAEVDAAIGKFEGLVTVYISAIEDLQARPDIALLPSKDQTTLVGQMEEIVSTWATIKHTLNNIKNQVEIAMEWEELWNNVLGEIGAEVENLSRLVFEMEERRHRVISESVAESAEKFDIAELETIVEETPRQQPNMHNKRFSMPPTLAVMSPISPIPQIEKENSRLLSLFAKLQPLRASLDFLPMRLASFQARARGIFPSACDELMRRKDQLEEQEKKLENEADALREELGEDKWVHSFRQAGSKAVAMYDSCMKSIQRLTQAIDEHDDDKLASRIATYKDKRDHYPPSMKRVLELIDIEMKHRSTVNGEILRIQQDVRQKVTDLESVIADMDAILDEFTAARKLRDSVSTVLSARTEASTSNSAFDTPNSSPASSVIMSRKSSDHGRMTPASKKSRQLGGSSSKPSFPANRRYSSVPVNDQGGFRISTLPMGRLDTTPSRPMSYTPTRSPMTPTSDRPAVKPRWNSSTNMRDTVVGHNFVPLTLTTPSPYGKEAESPRSIRCVSSQSSIPVRSPLSRSSAVSPPPSRPTSRAPAQQVARQSLSSPMQSPATPAKGKLPLQSTPRSSMSASTRQVTIAKEVDDSITNGESPIARRSSRPPSAANSRRSSMLPTPKQRSTSSTNMTPVSSPGRTSSRLGSIDEGRNSRAGEGRASRVSGRQSSAGDRLVWR
jgi:hypothetical protein